MADETLSQRLVDGDSDAVAELLKYAVTTARTLMRGYHLPPEDADDVAHETLALFLRKTAAGDPFQFQSDGHLMAYLRQALRNRLIERARAVRSHSAHIEDLSEDLTSADPSPLEQAMGQEALERYQAALSRLRPNDREAIIARIEMGLSYPEVAAALGKSSVPAAHMAVSRALARLSLEMTRGSKPR